MLFLLPVLMLLVIGDPEIFYLRGTVLVTFLASLRVQFVQQLVVKQRVGPLSILVLRQ